VATTVGTTPYSESLKKRRKVTATALNRVSAQKYVSHFDLETKIFCEDLLNEGLPGGIAFDSYPVAQRLSLSLALTTNWGIRMNNQNDKLFDEVIKVEDNVSRFRSVTGNMQDYIPLLRLSPFNKAFARAKDTRRRQDGYLSELNRGLDSVDRQTCYDSLKYAGAYHRRHFWPCGQDMWCVPLRRMIIYRLISSTKMMWERVAARRNGALWWEEEGPRWLSTLLS
jgi:hypothetical protein